MTPMPLPTRTPTALTGYRLLTDQEIALSNRIKEFGMQLNTLIAELETHLKAQYGEADATEAARIEHAQPLRWLAIGRTHIQQGSMALVRAVTQPSA